MVDATQYRKHAIKTNIPYMLALKRYWKPMLGTCEHALFSEHPDTLILT
jgi:hypothetical protein